MAMSTASYVLLFLLSAFVIALSIMILAYAGGIQQKGSDEMKAYKKALRKWLIGLASVLLILAVATLVVGSVQFAKPAPATSFAGLAARM